METQSDHPVVGAALFVTGLGLGLGGIGATAQFAAFIYILLWSLDRWEVIEIGLDDKLIFLEWVRWPIQALERFIANK